MFSRMTTRSSCVRVSSRTLNHSRRIVSRSNSTSRISFSASVIAYAYVQRRLSLLPRPAVILSCLNIARRRSSAGRFSLWVTTMPRRSPASFPTGRRPDRQSRAHSRTISFSGFPIARCARVGNDRAACAHVGDDQSLSTRSASSPRSDAYSKLSSPTAHGTLGNCQGNRVKDCFTHPHPEEPPASRVYPTCAFNVDLGQARDRRRRLEGRG